MTSLGTTRSSSEMKYFVSLIFLNLHFTFKKWLLFKQMDITKEHLLRSLTRNSDVSVF